MGFLKKIFPPPPDWSALLREAVGDRPELAREQATPWLSRNAQTRAEKHLLALFEKSSATRIEFARALMACGGNPGETDHLGQNALMIAVEHVDTDCVSFLASYCDIAARRFDQKTALAVAAFCGQWENILALLPHAGKIETPQLVEMLMAATEHGHVDCVEALLTMIISPATAERGLTSLMRAVLVGQAKCVQLLLPLQDAKAQSLWGRTALIMAADLGDKDCLRLLLPQSDPDAQTVHGATALMAAISNYHCDCVALLAPFSNTSVINSANLDAFDLAQIVESWRCVDELSPFTDLARVKVAMNKVSANAMPIARALIERQALSDIVSQARDDPPPGARSPSRL